MVIEESECLVEGPCGCSNCSNCLRVGLGTRNLARRRGDKLLVDPKGEGSDCMTNQMVGSSLRFS